MVPTGSLEFQFARKAIFEMKKPDIDMDELELPEVDNVVKYTLGLNDTKKIIKAMREYSKIDIEGEIPLIKTIRGSGYKIEAS